MTPVDQTALVLLAVGVVLLGWEFWTLRTKAPDDHITAVVRAAVAKHPYIAFLAGVLMGHLFWP